MNSPLLGLIVALLLSVLPASSYYMARPNTCGRPTDPPADAPWHIWIDFDQTLTINDTIATLGTSARHRDWDQVVTAYLGDYDAVVVGKPLPQDPFLLDVQLPTTALAGRWAVHDEVPVDPSKRAAMKIVEAEIQTSMVAEFRSIARINLVGIFGQMSNDQLEQVGRSEVQLQPGALDTLRSLETLGHVKVCSVNWSKAFIHGALHGAVPMADIVSSDIVQGKIDAAVVTGVDKVNLFAAAAAEGARSLFIGDSLHDVLAMVWADVGVLVVPPAANGVPKASLKRVLNRAGVEVVPLSQFGGVGLGGGEKGPVVYVTSSWAEIGKVLGEHL